MENARGKVNPRGRPAFVKGKEKEKVLSLFEGSRTTGQGAAV